MLNAFNQSSCHEKMGVVSSCSQYLSLKPSILTSFNKKSCSIFIHFDVVFADFYILLNSFAVFGPPSSYAPLKNGSSQNLKVFGFPFHEFSFVFIICDISPANLCILSSSFHHVVPSVQF